MQESIHRPALYVVATPIGNLGDITLRALETLRRVDLIAAEDTRLTGRLLAHFTIATPLVSLHRHNERRSTARVLAALRAGQAVALTTDAGTPAVSDPGAILVSEARANGYEVIPIPGASALIAAWSVSGVVTQGFLFHGFLPQRAGERRKLLQSLANIPYALVFYEAPHRIVEAARDLAAELGGGRRVIVARELTKMFESVHATTLGELAGWLQEQDVRQRGEFVLIVAGATQCIANRDRDGEALLRVFVEELPAAQAARLAARISGASRATLYDLAVKLRAGAPRDGA